MDQLRAMRVLVRAVDEGGFAKAARALDLAPSVVTRLIADLETQLGARLLNRNTRGIALTEVGEQYLERVRGILADLDEADELAGEATRVARGHVRLLMPPAVAVHQIAKHLPRFRAQHPQVTIEIAAPGPVETVDEAYDLTIFASRALPDGDFIARRLARTEVILCASPEYLERFGRPSHPRDLERMHAILPPHIKGLVTFHSGAWGDDEPGGETYTLRADSRPLLSTTHIDTMYSAALAGLGLAGLPSYVVEDALLEHALERVLPRWRLFEVTLWAGMPSRRHLPARTRAVLDFLLQVFGGEDRDPWLAAAGCETAAAA